MVNNYNVVSYRTAKRLHEAGVKLDTDFVYKDGYLLVGRKSIYFDVSRGFLKWFKKEDALPAPTFSELWDALPFTIESKNSVFNKAVLAKTHSFVAYRNAERIYTHTCGNGNLAEAAAEMLLHLKEKCLI